MAELSGEAIKLADLFSHRFFFKVPEYQRPFRWTDDNLTDLVTDLLEADWTSDYWLFGFERGVGPLIGTRALRF